MSDSDLPSTDDYPDVEAVREVIEEFLIDLSDGVDQDDLQTLLFGNLTFGDLSIGFKPEAYTEDNLIFPLLETVGLEHQRQPKTAGITRDEWPDFELINIDIPVIGESKPINQIAEGEDEIKEYLSIDGFDTPYGILTDGVDWRIYGPAPPSSSAGFTVVAQASLRKPLQTIAHQEDLISLLSMPGNPTINLTLPLTGFVTTFRREDFNRWSLMQLPKEARNQYMNEDTSYQLSFEDF